MKSVIFAAVVLGIIRVWLGLNVTPDTFSIAQAYKDVAHLFMGGLFVAMVRDKKHWQIGTFVVLCILEVTVAILSRI